MKKIPSKLRIKARTSYDLLFADIIKSSPEILGWCDPNIRQIIIKNGQSETELVKSVIHEILHAFEAEFDIDIPHKSVYKLEEAIHKFLVLNKFI